MSELKFRAWDIDDKQFIYAYIGQDDIWLDDGISTIEMPLHHSNFEQYTGLKDKNGKEIYEGDIIRCHGDDRFIAPVIRHEKSGGFCWVSCYKEECFIPESDEVEVIGNIYENKELLEGGK